jgi:hypothetical protein
MLALMLTPQAVRSHLTHVTGCSYALDAAEALCDLSDWDAYMGRRWPCANDPIAPYIARSACLLDDIATGINEVGRALKLPDSSYLTLEYKTARRWTEFCCSSKGEVSGDVKSLLKQWRMEVEALRKKLLEADDSGGYSSESAYTDSEDDTTDDEYREETDEDMSA